MTAACHFRMVLTDAQTAQALSLTLVTNAVVAWHPG